MFQIVLAIDINYTLGIPPPALFGNVAMLIQEDV
jgi:hypothetical protein